MTDQCESNEAGQNNPMRGAARYKPAERQACSDQESLPGDCGRVDTVAAS